MAVALALAPTVTLLLIMTIALTLALTLALTCSAAKFLWEVLEDKYHVGIRDSDRTKYAYGYASR